LRLLKRRLILATVVKRRGDQLTSKRPQMTTISEHSTFPVFHRSTLEPFPECGSERRLVVSRLRGRVVRHASRDSLSLGFCFWGCRRCQPVCDGTCFPCGMFLHCASNATCMSTRKRAWQRTPLLRSPSAKVPLNSWNCGVRSAQGNGRGSRTPTQIWFGIAVAPV